MPAGRRGSRPSFACATSYLSRAPPSPDSALPSQSGDARDFSLAPHPSLPLAAEKTTIDAERVYRLPDLIDIDESRYAHRMGEGPAGRTRRGACQIEYLPTISAMALGGYHRTWFQVPAGSNSLTVNPSGFLLIAQTARALASAGKEQAFSEALISATVLVFASGQLGSADAVPDFRK